MTLEPRVRELERVVAQLLRERVRQPDLVASAGPPLRLAKTVKDPNTGAYPAGGTAYWVKFLDVSFDDSDDGSPTLTKHDRQNTAKKVAYAIGAGDIAEGELVTVFAFQGRYYIQQGGGGGGSNCFLLFTLSATLNKTHASGLGQVQEVIVGSGPGVGDTINLVNPLHVATTRRVFEGNIDDLGLGLVRGDGDVQIVWIICPASRVAAAPQPPPEQTAQGGGSPPPQIINPGGPL